MKVFISWSGDRSKHIAETFQAWLRRVLQATDPWISTHIDKGLVWDNEISKNLNESRIGILCLTSDNLGSTYLHYEAGAISNVAGAIVCTFLFDVDSIDVKQPLSRFQNTKYTEEDILALLKTINAKLKEYKETYLLDQDLEENFKLFYPLLKEELDKTPATNQPKPKRDDTDLLEEILQGVRSLKTTYSSGYTTKNTFSIKSLTKEDRNKLYNLVTFYKADRLLSSESLSDYEHDIIKFIENNDPLLFFRVSAQDIVQAIASVEFS